PPIDRGGFSAPGRPDPSRTDRETLARIPVTNAPRAIASTPPSINAWNAEFLEAEYQRFLADPGSVPADLAAFFKGFDLGVARSPSAPPRAPMLPAGTAGGGSDASRFQAAVDD